jgi:hypothetical protein
LCRIENALQNGVCKAFLGFILRGPSISNQHDAFQWQLQTPVDVERFKEVVDANVGVPFASNAQQFTQVRDANVGVPFASNAQQFTQVRDLNYSTYRV